MSKIKYIPQSTKIIQVPSDTDYENMEIVARLSHQSEPKGAMWEFFDKLISLKHYSVFEFCDVTVVFKTSRAIGNELVRHRLCSYMQESTRYVNYKKKDVIKIIQASHYTELTDQLFENIADLYLASVSRGMKPEDARDILPLALASDIAVKANLKQWGYIYKMRFHNKKTHHMFRALLQTMNTELNATLDGSRALNLIWKISQFI